LKNVDVSDINNAEFKEYQGKRFKRIRIYPCLKSFAEMMNMKTNSSNSARLVMDLLKATRPSAGTAAVLLSKNKLRQKTTKNQIINLMTRRVLNQKNFQSNKGCIRADRIHPTRF
jgi:hypothetical protein